MKGLIKINYDGEAPTINSRELHKALKVETRYNDWFSRMCEYGFKPKKDFYSFLSESIGGRPKANHTLTIAMAKEICMLQRSEMGKKFREYFISVEEMWNSPDKVMERALQIAHRRTLEAEKKIFCLQSENETLEIALNTSLQYYTVARYNREFSKRWNMKQCQQIGKQMTGYCKGKGWNIQKCKTNDERFGETNSYPITAFKSYLNS